MKKTLSILVLLVAGMLLMLSSCDRSKGTHKGHEWVDLGLSSGTLWATCNVGASSPEDFGDYFAWAETSPKCNYTKDNLKYLSSYDTTVIVEVLWWDDIFLKYTDNDEKTVLDASDDAATANWGGEWSIPTKAELIELKEECIWEWTAPKGVYGYRVIGPNSNSIFLPAAGSCLENYILGAGSRGEYWSSSLSPYGDEMGEGLRFKPNKVSIKSPYRHYGMAVRPILRRSK